MCCFSGHFWTLISLKWMPAWALFPASWWAQLSISASCSSLLPEEYAHKHQDLCPFWGFPATCFPCPTVSEGCATRSHVELVSHAHMLHAASGHHVYNCFSTVILAYDLCWSAHQGKDVPVQDNPSITYVTTYIHNLVMKVPYLNWFVQPFDEAVHRSLKKGWIPTKWATPRDLPVSEICWKEKVVHFACVLLWHPGLNSTTLELLYASGFVVLPTHSVQLLGTGLKMYEDRIERCLRSLFPHNVPYLGCRARKSSAFWSSVYYAVF